MEANSKEDMNNQQRWDRIKISTIDAAKNTAGLIKGAKKKGTSPQVALLSQEQKEINLKIDSSKNNEEVKNLR